MNKIIDEKEELFSAFSIGLAEGFFPALKLQTSIKVEVNYFSDI